MKKLFKKKEELTAKYLKASGFQKGFTLIEMLAVVVIILILLGLVALAFTFFGRVDGTELSAESKNVESAVLQVALGDEERNIPGLDEAGAVETRADASATLVQGVDEDDFVNPNDAAVVIEAVAATQDLTGAELVQLMRPVDADRVQPSVSGKADAAEYFVVVKKAQLYKDGALDHFADYNDELAGQVFSVNTIIDSDGVYYNGTHVISADDAAKAEETAATASDVFTTVSGS